MSRLTKLSRQMSHALRHQPEQYDLLMDDQGWVELEDFAAKMGATVEMVQQVVAEDDKQRYTVTEGRIRAAQGHSIPVQIVFESPVPPAFLWHGTNEVAYQSIKETGLIPMQRQYVHLSASREQATIVGSRRKSELVMLRIDTAELIKKTELMISENGVWLASFVPAGCFEVRD